MGKILALVGESNSGKTTTIKLAAKIFSNLKFCNTQPILIAKYFLTIDIEIVEIYAVDTPEGKKHVAFVSHGDNYELICESLESIQVFINHANNGNSLINPSQNKKTANKNNGFVVKGARRTALYKTMSDYLIANYFQQNIKLKIDVLVLACHDDGYQIIQSYLKANLSNTFLSYKTIGIDQIGKIGADMKVIQPTNPATVSYIDQFSKVINAKVDEVIDAIVHEL